MSVLVGIVPAAGHAHRLQPLSGSKEVIPIGGKPVMDCLLERMRAAGCTQIRVVTRPEKGDVVDNAQRHGAAVIHGCPGSVAESLLLALEGLDAEDIVLFGFPDTIWEPEGGFVGLVAAVEAGHPVALGLFRSEEPERSDVVFLDARGRPARIEVKPAAPRTDLIWGCAAARAGILGGLADYAEPGAYLDHLCRVGEVAGVELSGPFVDVGTTEALARARPSR